MNSSLNKRMSLISGLQSLNVDVLCEQVLVLLEWVVRCAELIVWWADSLLETAELLGLLHVSLDGVIEILL